MPIYSFKCPNGHESELRCKADERGTQVCPEPGCGVAMAHDGHIEGGNPVRPDGKYRMKLVMGDGRRVEVAHHKGARSDW